MNPIQAWLWQRKLHAPEEWARLQAIAALGETGRPDAVPLLVPLLQNDSIKIVGAAAEALAVIRTPAAFDELARAIRDAMVAGGNARSQRSGLIDFGLPSLIGALGKFGPEAAPILLTVLQNRSAESATHGFQLDVGALHFATLGLAELRHAGAVGLLLEILKDRNPGLRDAAARALGKIGDRRAVAPLEACLNDDTKFVRDAVVEALDELGWQPNNAAQHVAQAMARHDYEAAVAAGPAAIRPLLREIWDACGWQTKRSRRDGPPPLPHWDVLKGPVSALEQILKGHGAAIDPDDLATLAKFSDLSVEDTGVAVTEDYGSGHEFERPFTFARTQSCADLRQRAAILLQNAEKVVVRCPNPECGQQIRLRAGRHGTVQCPNCSRNFEATT